MTQPQSNQGMTSNDLISAIDDMTDQVKKDREAGLFSQPSELATCEWLESIGLKISEAYRVPPTERRYDLVDGVRFIAHEAKDGTWALWMWIGADVTIRHPTKDKVRKLFDVLNLKLVEKLA